MNLRYEILHLTKLAQRYFGNGDIWLVQFADLLSFTRSISSQYFV